jgi:hypothetical protein
MDANAFLVQFQDYLAPRLDVYEQAVYLYIFRHTRLHDIDEATIGFKSSRIRMACGVGEKGKPMSETTAYLKLASLSKKGAITILRTDHGGRRIRLHLPSEIPEVIPAPNTPVVVSIEEMDFFEVPENRQSILKREGFKCFYTLQTLDEKNFVLDHIVSRPNGDNSYRNLVAASREANNRKGNTSAEDFLRRVFREGFLNEVELRDRLQNLSLIKEGKLRPIISASA